MPLYSYSLLVANVSDIDEEEKDSLRSSHRFTALSGRHGVFALAIIVILSLSINVLLLHQRFHEPWKLYNDLPTQYAHLRRNVPKDIVPLDKYTSRNRSVQDTAWNQPNMKTWELFLALEEDYVISQGLPHSQRWPWDTKKGVYIPVGAHELHCTQVIRSYINDKEDKVSGNDMEWHFSHALHCLNVLRESVMCNADDQPMYTGRLHANVHSEEAVAGRGMIRMCRSWDGLVEWARSHSACYESIHRDDPNFPELDRYKHCPDNSRPWEKSMIIE